jgi:very-short-patch-repair endonuclease
MNPLVKTPKYVIERAQELRVNMTPTEKLLWDRLKEKQIDGYRFRRQHPIYRYILDFYCAEKSFAIEIDGGVHDKNKEYDEYRDKVLESLGIKTLRIKDDEVIDNIDEVIKKVRDKLVTN